MSLLLRKRTIIAKIEAVEGTDPVPTGAANAVLVRALKITPMQTDQASRELIRAYLGNYENIPAAIHMMVECEVEVAGGGAPLATPPKFGPLLRACGLTETINAGVSVVYAPRSAGFESVTIYANVDGVVHKGNMCRGSVSLGFNVLQLPVFRFRFVGLFVPVADAALPTCDYTGFQKPLAFNNDNASGFTLHGFAGALQSLELDLANVVNFQSLVGAERVNITDRKPTGRISMEAVLVATKDYWTNIQNATTGALALLHGTVLGNKVAIAAPNVQLLNPSYEDMDGVAMLNSDLILVPGGTGNDELTITLT